ncbi:hypothetical protein [Phenylobacterium sp.]|jgi:hypothetical protein|uniref:hypothetical protein n=1 Tax=Phenylobacterium sp. TaxID=1871053 RepID=UPI002F423864
MDEREEKRIHDNVSLVGLRAHATAVGFLTLARELVRAGVLDEAAVDRIKEAIVKELSVTRSRATSAEEFERTTRHRLDGLFAGDEPVGGTPPPEMAAGRPEPNSTH